MKKFLIFFGDKTKYFINKLRLRLRFGTTAKIVASSLLFSLVFSGLFSYLTLAKIGNLGNPSQLIKNEPSQQDNGKKFSFLNKDLGISSAENSPQDKELTVVQAVEKTLPSVVSIVITKEVPKYEVIQNQTNPFGNLFGNDPFSFFFNQPQYRQNGTEKKEIGGGTGFVVSRDGLIVTNKHVASDDSAQYTAVFSNGKKYDAKIMGRDSVYDIAILKISGSNFVPLELGDSDNISLGQSVIAIGNALAEFQNSVSVGIVSGLARSITATDQFGGNSESLEKVIQTDAAINPGNSGGPLIDLNGKAIGVNVAVVSGAQNIGFALPINVVKSIISSLNQNGKITRPYIGVRYVLVNTEIAQKNNLPYDYGALIKSDANGSLGVIPGSPADKSGLAENDIILEIDGNKIDENNSLAYLIRGKKNGETINLKVYSKGQIKNLKLVVGSTEN